MTYEFFAKREAVTTSLYSTLSFYCDAGTKSMNHL
jgi:hypothetical protein